MSTQPKAGRTGPLYKEVLKHIDETDMCIILAALVTRHEYCYNRVKTGGY